MQDRRQNEMTSLPTRHRTVSTFIPHICLAIQYFSALLVASKSLGYHLYRPTLVLSTQYVILQPVNTMLGDTLL